MLRHPQQRNSSNPMLTRQYVYTARVPPEVILGTTGESGTETPRLAAHPLNNAIDVLDKADPLRVGHCGHRCCDGVHHLCRAVRLRRPGAPPERPGRGFRLELWRNQPCVQPPVGGPGPGQSLRGTAGRPLRRSVAAVCWCPAVHCRHDAHGHHEQSVAILPVLWRCPGGLHHHLHRADRIGRHPVVQEAPGSRHGRGLVVPGSRHDCAAFPDRRRVQPVGDEVDLLAAGHSGRGGAAAAGQVLSQRTRRHRTAPAGRSRRWAGPADLRGTRRQS